MARLKDTMAYIKSDFVRYGINFSFLNLVQTCILGNHSVKFTFWLRMCKHRGLLFPVSKLMYNYYKNKYGLQIPYTTKIGYGLYLGHGINVVVNNTAIIGDNCNISHGVTIGSNNDKAASIGNNVYIGPNVCIVENVRISNNVTIGAGAVIVKDIEEDATVAGNPARIISHKQPGRFIVNRYHSNKASL